MKIEIEKLVTAKEVLELTIPFYAYNKKKTSAIAILLDKANDVEIEKAYKDPNYKALMSIEDYKLKYSKFRIIEVNYGWNIDTQIKKKESNDDIKKIFNRFYNDSLEIINEDEFNNFLNKAIANVQNSN
jgi:hypothetical protein